jgi:hypothetical protein
VVQSTPKPPDAPPKIDPPAIANVDEKPAAPKAVPISLPKEELVNVDLNRDADKKEPAENSQPAGEKLVEPPRRLVPVASDPISAGAPDICTDQIVRLPPIDMEPASPANQYTAGTFGSAIPIYPSTGK